jgi:hypothetical protein
MIRICLVTLSILFSLTTITLDAKAKNNELPQPPSGFTWKNIKEIQAFFLLPDNWHYKEEQNDKTFAIFLSKEKIMGNNQFDTGMTINVFRNQASAPKQLVNMIKAVSKHHKSEITTGENKDFFFLNTQYDSVAGSDNKIIRSITKVIINKATRTSYMILYESPVETWTTRKIISEMFALEENI